MPPIIVLLDYNRFRTRSLAERLVRQRTSLGMSQKEAPREIGVDQGTLERWEREPTGELLDGFPAGDRGQRMRVRRAG